MLSRSPPDHGRKEEKPRRHRILSPGQPPTTDQRLALRPTFGSVPDPDASMCSKVATEKPFLRDHFVGAGESRLCHANGGVDHSEVIAGGRKTVTVAGLLRARARRSRWRHGRGVLATAAVHSQCLSWGQGRTKEEPRRCCILVSAQPPTTDQRLALRPTFGSVPLPDITA